MKRRSFLSQSAKKVAVASLASSVMSTPAIGRGLRRLKMITTWPRDFPGFGIGANRLADNITRMSSGRLEIKVYAAGDLVQFSKTFDAVSNGEADIYHAIEYYFQHRSRALNFFASVPFGLTANELAAWIYHGEGQELWDEVSASFNIKPFQVGNTGSQMGGWYNREINTIEDFKGLKIRIPGLGGEVLARIGSKPIVIPGGQIFMGLKSGKLDATEWAGPWGDLELELYKVSKYYYYPGFYEPGTAISAGFNTKVWNSLDDDLKVIVNQATMAENNFSRAEFQFRNADALFKLRQGHNVKVKRFSKSIMSRIGVMSGEVISELGVDGDNITRRVYESFKKFRSKSLPWTNYGEQSFLNARSLPFNY